MNAEFGQKRESNNNLFFAEWENDAGKFQFHSQLELYFVLDGEMEVLIGDRKRLLRKGEMSFATSYMPHGYSTPSHSRSAALIIPTYLCEEFLALTKGRTPTDPYIIDADDVEELYSLAKELGTAEMNSLRRQGYIYLILGKIYSLLEFEETTRPLDSSLGSQMLFYISSEFRNGITPADVAKRFGYSESYLCRHFTSTFGITPLKYINTLKLKNAVMLLHEKRHSVTYCALESGFTSLRSFYRLFRSTLSCTPREYLEGL